VVYSVNSEMTSAAGPVVMITGNPPKLVETPPYENTIQNAKVGLTDCPAWRTTLQLL